MHAAGGQGVAKICWRDRDLPVRSTMYSRRHLTLLCHTACSLSKSTCLEAEKDIDPEALSNAQDVVHAPCRLQVVPIGAHQFDEGNARMAGGEWLNT